MTEMKTFRESQPNPVDARLATKWESPRNVNARIHDFLDDIKQRPEQTILVVTSSHPAKHFRVINENRPLEEVIVGSFPNAKPYEIELS